MTRPDSATAVCAGDRFISPELLAAAAADAGLSPAGLHRSSWPDVPFRAVDGVREAAGEPQELAGLLAEASVLLTHLAPVTAEVLDAGRQLRAVGVTRGGPVNVDVGAATVRGVPVLFLPGRNLSAVAEFVIGAMISSMRGIVRGAAGLREGRWDASSFRYDQAGTELSAATVGLVGLGAVGSRVAVLAGAFGARVLAHDPFASPEAFAAAGAEPVGLQRLLAGSDVVSVHARLADETRGMFDAAAFGSMRRGAHFVNTARGELVDQAALRAALDSGQLAGAVLDVFDPEPPPADDPLLHDPRVLPTPHLAGASRQVAQQSAERVARDVAAFLATGRARHCANPQVLDDQPRRAAGRA